VSNVRIYVKVFQACCCHLYVDCWVDGGICYVV